MQQQLQFMAQQLAAQQRMNGQVMGLNKSTNQNKQMSDMQMQQFKNMQNFGQG